MRRLLTTAAGLLCGMLLGGCALFGGDDDAPGPAELVDFEETLDVERLWRAKLGKGSEFLRLALRPAGDGRRVYAASRDGNVLAFDPRSGERIWRAETRVSLSAGPAVGRDRVVVGGSDGDLITLAAEDGREMWRINVDGEVLAAPVIKDDVMVVYTIDGTLRALSIFDGKQRWSLEQSLPPLTLRGAAPPVVVGSSVIAGFDNGRLLSVDLDDGTVEWDVVLAPPSGRSDLERLADVDGMITAVGQDVYATGYQGRLASLAAESGQILWSRELSTHTGVSADWNYLYTSVDNGEVLALSRQTGDEQWRQDTLLRRSPSVPVPFDTAVAVGDFEGYLHFFSNVDGRPVARRRVGKGMISGAPVVIGGILFAQSESGELAAFAVPERDPEPAADDAP